ncbi:hypothetical protein U1Q18_013613 [Sarracenia purpurea var. burkii]
MRIKFFTWVLSIITALIIFSISTISQVHSQCLEDQRSLLLQLKTNLKFDSSISTKLVNWNNQSSDCCHWRGVTCDNAGRVVISLDLSSESISGGLGRASSLFRLQFLERLNLANNSFNLKLQTDGSATSLNLKRIPSSFGNLAGLTYLNLSNAGFAGNIPFGLSRLTRLVTLDLSALYFPGILSLQLENADLLRLLQNLTVLTDLRLDGVNISARGPEWGQTISSSLPNLRVLSLSSCYLSGPIDSSLLKLQFLSEIHMGSNNLSAPVPEFFANFSNLTTLRLSSSNLYGDFPEKILLLPTLQTLRLEDNKFLKGSLPQFPQNGSLQILVLSDTNFSGTLPNSIGNLRNLSRIDISFCNFNGSIPISMENLSQLVYLDLSGNNFTGPVPSFQTSKNLRYIDLPHNVLTGPVPSSHFEGLSNLINIDLAYNSLNGRVPSSLFSLPSLQKIQLSNNHFGGQIVRFPKTSLAPLSTLDLSSNKLEGPIPTSFFDFSTLNILSLSFNNFNGTIQLEKFQKLQNLTTLELSYNSLLIITGESSSSLSSSFPQLRTLLLASCKLQNFPALMNQSSIIRLDLSNNQISGEIPNWIWDVGNGSLSYLNLSHNLLVDLQKPYTIPSFLSVLDLHSNQLGGEIPLPPELAIYLDYSNNNFSSFIPAEIGKNLIYAVFFSLSNNSLTGAIARSICNGWGLQVLDLSSNRLSGSLPQCLVENSTKTLGVLNLRNNNLTGHISGIFPEGCALKTLDLNGNYLEGRVPESLTNCTKLEVLNIGNNKITDNFPCFLKNSSSVSVLVLRFNKFQGDIHCQGVDNNTWQKLQIIDLALNNFSGVLPPNPFLDWKAMMVDVGNAQSDLNGHLHFPFLTLNKLYYQDTVTVTNKGLEMKLVKILTIFTSIDLSCNGFEGKIPGTIGDLNSLYVLNLSHNAFAGQIPSSFGNLKQLGSLDISSNRLSGSIPMTLARLTFLSFLNLSYNQLVGKIPGGSQFQTFTEASFEGNGGLCGPPLNNSCIDAKVPGSTPLTPEDWHSDSETDDIYLCAAVGVVLGSSLSSSFPQLRTLLLASCKLQNFPALKNQSSMIRLDLSNNQISGEIPNWIWDVGNGSLSYLNLSHNLLVDLQKPYTIPSSLSVLDLHSNQLHGEIPLLPDLAVYVDYSSNSFGSSIPAEIGKNLTLAIFFSLSNNSRNGAIPQSICNALFLLVLDLSSNRLNGTIPPCLIENSTGVLNLQNNGFSSHISGTFPEGCALKTLDLDGNSLEGQVPESLTNCTNLEVLNLGNNKINDKFPGYLKNSSSLRVLVLRLNKFHGDIGCPGINNNNG